MKNKNRNRNSVPDRTGTAPSGVRKTRKPKWKNQTQSATPTLPPSDKVVDPPHLRSDHPVERILDQLEGLSLQHCEQLADLLIEQAEESYEALLQTRSMQAASRREEFQALKWNDLDLSALPNNVARFIEILQVKLLSPKTEIDPKVGIDFLIQLARTKASGRTKCRGTDYKGSDFREWRVRCQLSKLNDEKKQLESDAVLRDAGSRNTPRDLEWLREFVLGASYEHIFLTTIENPNFRFEKPRDPHTVETAVRRLAKKLGLDGATRARERYNKILATMQLPEEMPPGKVGKSDVSELAER